MKIYITFIYRSLIYFISLTFTYKLTFLNKCDENDKSIIAEYFQRVFDIDLPESELNKIKKE